METLSAAAIPGQELFERAAGAKAQLLRADRVAPLGGDDATRAVAYLLTFDVGRILVAAEPAAAQLTATLVPDPDAAPSGLLDASEEEPWWRILGTPLARVEASAGRLALAFLMSGGRSRTLTLALDGARVHASLADDA